MIPILRCFRPHRFTRVCLGWFAVLISGTFPLLAKEKHADKTGETGEYAKLFSNGPILHLRLELSTNAMETLGKAQGGFGQQSSRENVVGVLREGDRSYPGVQIHLKGAAGSFRPVNDKPAFTLSMDKQVKSQRFHGLRKFSLNNSVQDPTYLSEQVCRELFLEAGVPVPQATQVHLELNGRDLGMYVLVEGWDRDFLARRFPDPSGVLYDGGFVKDVGETLAVNVGDPNTDQADRKALVAALEESDPVRRAERLRKVLDVERFLSLMAMEVIVWDWDGYPMNRNNWRLYHEPSSDKMVFMPHGMDQMFWKPEGSVLPRVEGRVAQAVMESAELRKAYLERLRSLRTRVFDVPRWTNRVQRIAQRIQAELGTNAPGEGVGYAQRIADFQAAMGQRAASLDRQLSHPIEPASFDAQGLASLTGWSPKEVFGAPGFSPTNAPGAGQPARIFMSDGSSIGIWKTGLWLEKGRYALQGRVKLKGVVADPGDSRGGAGLQVQGDRMEKPLLGTVDWQPLEYEFYVGDALSEMQLACELRAAQGEAWFDLDAFRIRKLPLKPEDERPDPRERRRRPPPKRPE